MAPQLVKALYVMKIEVRRLDALELVAPPIKIVEKPKKVETKKKPRRFVLHQDPKIVIGNVS